MLSLESVWITNDGEVISYKSMDENHVKNIQNFLIQQKRSIPQGLQERLNFFKNKLEKERLF